MLEKLRFYTRHSLNDLRVNGQRTIFVLLCIAAGVAAIVSLQTLGVMIEDALTSNLQESNRADIRIYAMSDWTEHGPDHDEDEESRPQSKTTDELIDEGIEEGVIIKGGWGWSNYISVDTPPDSEESSGLDRIREWFEANTQGEVEITYSNVITSFGSGSSASIPAKDTTTLPVPYIIETQKYPLYGERVAQNSQPLSALFGDSDGDGIITDIVISRNMADALDADIGDQVRLSGATEDFTLTGIVPTNEESGLENFEGALLGYYYIDVSALTLFQDLDPGASMVYVKLEDPTNLETLADDFNDAFPYLETTTTQDLKEENSQLADAINQTVIIMGLVSLLIGGIGIVNTMLVVVSRRTTEIAVLKTIGLEGEQITVLFLTEAVLMGFFGSLIGIVLGWIGALAIQGVAERFLSQPLTFRITPLPALTGLIVGMVVTTIFGFIPTLAAAQIRPNLVLRPSDTVVPRAGRARSFVALLVVILSLSVVAQSLSRDLLDSDALRGIAQSIGGGLGLLLGLTILGGGLLAHWVRGNIGLRIVRWIILLVGLPLLGQVFGQLVPALMLLTGAFVIVGVLYVMLWALIWSVGGGALADLWFLKLDWLRGIRKNLLRSTLVQSRLGGNRILSFLVVDVPLSLVTGLVWLLNSVLIVVMVPFWLLGHLIQRLAFVDFKLALRSMLTTKGRGASTLLALVVGVFTLGLITMLTTTMTKWFEELMEDAIGGNVIIMATGTGDTLEQVKTRLESFEADGSVTSYAMMSTYEAELVRIKDTSENRYLDFEDLQEQVRAEDEDLVDQLDWTLDSVDAREIDSNLPDVDFYKGRQLKPFDVLGDWTAQGDDYPPIVISANDAIAATTLDVNDLLTFSFTITEQRTALNVRPQTRTVRITFKIVGMIDRTGEQISVNFGSPNYAPMKAFKGMEANMVSAIVEMDEARIPDLRRSMNEVTGAFMLESGMLNDLINRIIDRFTAFPILVAALSLIVGGIVIANSVALSTLERQREIAIMKAVGLQRERVLGMLLFEFGLMGLIGGLIGVGLGGLGLLFLLAQAFGGVLGNTIPYVTAMELMGLCVLIALVAAILTAWRASGEKPLNVLRYE